MSQPIPISKTKIIVPNRRPELLSRPRLLENLRSLLDNKLILLSAPAGYGKTSLLIDLANHVDMPVCWLSLDPLDRDPQRFIAYLIASLSERFPGIGAVARAPLSRLKSIERDAEALLVTITNEIYEQIEEDFLLILDDYHLLDDVPVISDIVNRFLELVVENCHVVLSSRTLPPLEDVTLMIAREQVAGISHVDLAFQAGEVQALYAQNYHQRISDETAQEYVSQTGGWITGMVLSNLPGIPRVSGVDAFAYLGQQVLERQPDHIREFLLRTSLPDEFNAEFCGMVLGPLHPSPPNWYDIMSFILEKNLFVLPLDSDGRWLRYHPLFREFLQTRLREERPHEVHPILENMVKAYEKTGDWEKAYYTCKQLDDSEALADVIEKAGVPMLQNALVTLESWINSLPPSIIQTRPGLISLRGPILAVKGDLQGSRELLDMAVSICRQNQNIAGLVPALIRRANTLRVLGNYAASLENINEALQLAGTDASLQYYYAEGLRLKGLNLYRLGESRQSVESLEHSLSLYSAMKESNRIPIVLMETGMAYHAVGDIDSARNSYQKALALKQAESDLFAQADILNNLAVLYHQIGEYELASETFEAGLICARKSRNRHAESLILSGLGDLFCEVDEFDLSAQSYRQAELAAGDLTGFIKNYLIIARGNLALSREDFDEANSIVKKNRKKFRTTQSAYELGLWLLFEGKYQLLRDNHKKSIQLIDEARELFIQDGRDLEWQWGTVWLSAAHCKDGKYGSAVEAIKEILSDSSTLDHALIIVLQQATPWLAGLQSDPYVGRKVSGLLQKAERIKRKMPIIRRNLRRHASFVQVPSARLVIRAFGNPEITVAGRVVQMSDWRTQSVRDLFLYFLQSQEAVTKEQVGAILWPETPSIQAVKARFKNEIYRLRRAVGRDIIVFEDEYYRFNHQMDYEYDVEAFDSHISRARKTTNTVNRIGHLQKAVDLVHGPYLADIDAEWAYPERERLWQVYGSALEELAYLYLDAGRLENCMHICQLALKRDRFQETIYQIEMRAYAIMGDRSAIARRYQACKAAMAELSLSPSIETERIYQELAG
jgi:LuxR family transcriptional regulator, maltose regulon positive regulatory protein